MIIENVTLVSLLKEIMRRRQRLPSQLATDIGISHASISRWMSGKDVPSTKSCRKLAEYSGESLEKILSAAGHFPQEVETEPRKWPEFREYASKKYPTELDEDLIMMIENLIEHRRGKKRGKKKA